MRWNRSFKDLAGVPAAIFRPCKNRLNLAILSTFCSDFYGDFGVDFGVDFDTAEVTYSGGRGSAALDAFCGLHKRFWAYIIRTDPCT
jgi:hypothetical protein